MIDTDEVNKLKDEIAHERRVSAMYLASGESVLNDCKTLTQILRQANEKIVKLTSQISKQDKELSDARSIMEGVLIQIGYTCMSAYEDVEEFLGVKWDRDRQQFAYPNGRLISDPIDPQCPTCKGEGWVASHTEAGDEHILRCPCGAAVETQTEVELGNLHQCKGCRTTTGVTLGTDPYLRDVEGDTTEHWMCEHCRDERAADI